jgi:hypothetical protein
MLSLDLKFSISQHAHKLFGTTVGIEENMNVLDSDLGKNSKDILERFLSLSDEELERLRRDGVVWA